MAATGLFRRIVASLALWSLLLQGGLTGLHYARSDPFSALAAGAMCLPGAAHSTADSGQPSEQPSPLRPALPCPLCTIANVSLAPPVDLVQVEIPPAHRSEAGREASVSLADRSPQDSRARSPPTIS